MGGEDVGFAWVRREAFLFTAEGACKKRGINPKRNEGSGNRKKAGG